MPCDEAKKAEHTKLLQLDSCLLLLWGGSRPISHTCPWAWPPPNCGNHIIQHIYAHTCRYDQETRMPGRGFMTRNSKPDYRQSNGRRVPRHTTRRVCHIFCACGPKARAVLRLLVSSFVCDCLPFLALACLKYTHFGLLSTLCTLVSLPAASPPSFSPSSKAWKPWG